jgi:hypothetical protein
MDSDREKKCKNLRIQLEARKNEVAGKVTKREEVEQNALTNQLNFQDTVPKLPLGRFSAEKKIRSFPSDQCYWCCPVPKLSQVKISMEKIQKLSFQLVPRVPPSAKTSARRVFCVLTKIQKLFFQPVPLVPPSAKTTAGQVFRGKKFRIFSSNQCHWCCLAPKLPQGRFVQKKIQKLSFRPVPLVLASAKTSSG